MTGNQMSLKVASTTPQIRTQLIPAIRQIGAKGSTPDAFDGRGIIDRLAKLQNPDVHNQQSRQGFHAIQDFLRDVIDRPDARIEVPYERTPFLFTWMARCFRWSPWGRHS